jgi:endoglucanase
MHPWEKRDSLLVTKDEFVKDLKDNYRELGRAGVKMPAVRWFLAPYEWYNSTIALMDSRYGFQTYKFYPRNRHQR